MSSVEVGDDVYIGLVRAIGTDLDSAVDLLRSSFQIAGFTGDQFRVVKLSGLLEGLLAAAKANPDSRINTDATPVLSDVSEGRYNYFRTRMDAGDWLRTNLGASVLAQRAVAAVRQIRSVPTATTRSRPGTVFVFDSVMHPDEVKLFRSVYGKRFFLIAVHSVAEVRARRLLDDLRSSDPSAGVPLDIANLATDVADTKLRERSQANRETCEAQVEELMDRDEGLSDPSALFAPPNRRVSIRKTFDAADVFVALPESGATATGRQQDGLGVIRRFVEKLFGEPFHTPTRTELGMAHAYVAARRSAALSRTVGAAICTSDGDLLAVGVNEVPAPGGGHYWPEYDGGKYDQREHRYEWTDHSNQKIVGVDPNDQIKIDIFRELLIRVFGGLTNDDITGSNQQSLLNKLKNDPDGVIAELLRDDQVRSSQFFDVIEYGRSLHAEMSALITCARLGIAVRGAVLFCTTFPCHECSRLLIAAGISRVIYVEPYSKSRVASLHSDAVEIEKFTGAAHIEAQRRPGEELVSFEPFIGFSPERQGHLYSWVDRKIDSNVDDPNSLGKRRHWELGPDKRMRNSIVSDLPQARVAEDLMIDASERFIEEALRTAKLLDDNSEMTPDGVTPLQ